MKTTQRKTAVDDWQTLPDSIEAIEAGKPLKQKTFFEERRDNTQAGRVARLLGTVPGIRAASEIQ